MIFYKDLSQISELADYEYVAPTYGETTTDPTYYEPQASRIANMRKSAGSLSSGAYDFTESVGDDFDPENDPHSADKVHTMLGRKPGLLREEVSQIATQNLNNIKRSSKSAEEKENLEKISKQQNKDFVKEVLSEVSSTGVEE